MTDQPDQRLPEPTTRYRWYEILEVGAIDDPVSRLVDKFMIALIIANVIAVILETVDPIYNQFATAFYWFEVVTVIIFSVEYIVRLWVCVERSQAEYRPHWRVRLRYMFTPMALVDLAAILPFFLYNFIPDLRFLRILRLFRLFKLIRYSPALVTLSRVIQSERRSLTAAGVVMVGLIVTAGSVMYYLERHAQPEVFSHIPDAMWWAIATLTTVGYGDVTPVTDIGKLFGGIVMIFGLGMYALPIGIIASGFANEIGQRDFVITWHALVRVPLFSHLNAASVSHIAGLLKAKIVNPGEIIARIGDPAEDMFFILSGEVEVQTKSAKFTLGEGDYFGEIALLTGSERLGSAKALARSHLMTLSKEDLQQLMLDDVPVRHAILDAIRNRLTRGSYMGKELSQRDLERIIGLVDEVTESFV